MTTMRPPLLAIACALAGALTLSTGLRGQETATPKPVAIDFSDPSRPGRLDVHLVQGGMTIKGYDGKDVTIEARVRAARSSGSVANTATGLQAEEENNEVRVRAVATRVVDLTIRVPRTTSLKLAATHDGDIVVQSVDGDVEATNINGGVRLDGIGGGVVAHALNGNLSVRLTRVPGGTPMSFSSMNGHIDVTLPATARATIKAEAQRGKIVTDFDVTPPTPGVPVRVKKALSGLINGGGPDYIFKAYKGDIRIHKEP